jgi:hypothetical protein
MTSSSRSFNYVASRRAFLGLAAGTALVPVAASGGAAHAAGRPAFPPKTIALPTGFRPEGITSDPGLRYYVGSVSDGEIYTGNLLSGSGRTLWPGATGRSLRGLYYDVRTNLVWTVGNVGEVAHVWAIRASSGTIASDTLIPGGVFLNDLVVTRSAVYITDSQVDRLAVVSLYPWGMPTGARASFVPLSGAWPAGNGSSINANGIRELSDGSLVLNNSRVGGLWQVNPTTGVTTEIPVSGGPAIVSGDGLERRGSLLYNVRGSGPDQVAVVRLSRSASGWRATWVTALTDETLDVPTTATAAGAWLWAVNARFGVPSPETASYSITRLPLR